MITKSEIGFDQRIAVAVRHLSQICDGAQTEDGQGFAQCDVSFGHRLAATPEDAWTMEMAAQGYKIVRKYQNQLRQAGFDVDDIDEPKTVAREGRRLIKSITVGESGFVVGFSYDADLVSAIKRVRGARFQARDKTWLIPLEQGNALKLFAELYDFGVSQDAVDAMSTEYVAPVVSVGRVFRSEDVIVITFRYDAALVDVVRGIPGRAFDRVTATWRVPMSSVGHVIDIATKYGLDIDESIATISEDEQQAEPSAVSISGGLFEIRFPYDRDVIARVRDLPTAQWSRSRYAWTVDLDAAMEVVEFVDALESKIDASAERVIEDARLALQRVADSSAEDAELEVSGLGGELRPFQRAGVTYALRTRRCWIADEMGLGKTVQALAALELANAFPAVVVCLASTKINWVREAEKWLPNRSVQMIVGGKTHPVDADVIILNYDVLDAWADVLPTPKAVVFDESHSVKNGKAIRTKAAVRLADRVDNDGLRLLLTGTPVLNRPMELVTQLRILGLLEEFGGVSEFKKRYGANKNLTMLNRRMRATGYVRRRKADVLSELPDKQWATIPVEGNPEIMRRYRSAEADVSSFLAQQAKEAAEEAGASSEVAFEDAMRAKFRANQAVNLAKIGVLRRLAADAKMDSARAWIEDFLESGSKLVVFGEHRRIVSAIDDEFSKGCKVQGGIPDVVRQKMIDAFQTDDNQKVISCSLGAGGVGLTLTAASDVLFLEQGWNPAVMEQAADRCHRIGQKDSVTAWNMLCVGTVDEDIAELIERKRAIVNAATDGVETSDQSNVAMDLMVRLATRK